MSKNIKFNVSPLWAPAYMQLPRTPAFLRSPRILSHFLLRLPIFVYCPPESGQSLSVFGLEELTLTMVENKIICVIGATGNQGGSVARRFLKAGFRVRGLTRDTLSPAAQKLATDGIEVMKADLDDLESLKLSLKNANVIFSVTNYWEAFFRPDCRQKASGLGISPARFAYDVEYQQGRNIADAAAATCDSLDPNGFLVSTLSHASKSSQGKFIELYHFDSKADIFPFYVRENYPDLAAKMSCIQTGYFYTSFNILPDSYFHKASNIPMNEEFY